jgi:hypothetical protein
LLKIKQLNRSHRGLQEALPGVPKTAISVWPPAGFWARRICPSAPLLTAALLLPALGCGHATVPCPTPTTALDSHRQEVERLDGTVGSARAAERAEKSRRDGAARRVAAARAALDSLPAAAGPRK